MRIDDTSTNTAVLLPIPPAPHIIAATTASSTLMLRKRLKNDMTYIRPFICFENLKKHSMRWGRVVPIVEDFSIPVPNGGSQNPFSRHLNNGFP